MISTIVTGVDGTDTAREAARTAARLAQTHGAALHLLSAFGPVDVKRVNTEGVKVAIDFKQPAEQTASEETALLRSEFPDLEITGGAAEGKPADALVDAAEQLGADLIVVGNKRVQGLARILGSIAADVARHAPCDVYIAHTHQRS
ncbi:universal stress protein [Nocardioides insulae]|uniref:universal stress protein n=1 Tax=Nocardioides insulae TaxID=394734 RepID=UPI000405AD3F|nr:universal stress protein [Nocardioides insulae]